MSIAAVSARIDVAVVSKFDKVDSVAKPTASAATLISNCDEAFIAAANSVNPALSTVNEPPASLTGTGFELDTSVSAT